LSALMSLTLSDDNGNDVTVPVTMRTVLRWEQTFNGTFAEFGGGQVKAQWIYELGFLAYKKESGYANSFEAFCDSYDVTPVDEAGVVPTPTVPAV